MSLCLLASALLLLTSCSTSRGGTPTDLPASPETAFATPAQVLDAVKAAQNTATVPDSVAATLQSPNKDLSPDYFDCQTLDDGGTHAKPFGGCAVGDKNGSKLMVIYGDSHAWMWSAALMNIAAKNGWKLRAFGLDGCPAADLQFFSYQTNSPNANCDKFHKVAVDAIAALKPDLIITASISHQMLADGTWPTPTQWAGGLKTTFSNLAPIGAKLAMFGDIPGWVNNDAHCLAAHLRNVQACSTPVADAVHQERFDAEKNAAESSGALYIPTTQWVCTGTCEPIIADTLVYSNQYHFTNRYVEYLTGAITESMKPVLG
ncbi:SGNH hydrolase domain-containing protein [Mycobacterium sp. JS623]|uniref:SGNH hydrolase domain-containing protein n=1 Tax=Mycobacterium sp. JS623 TaxID=212767 RepID=UPI0006866193|nr:SGNH hydrolase domain-containing protein [Mycobacterium sp. JS623]